VASRDQRAWIEEAPIANPCLVTRAVDKPAIAGWLDANLALVAEFNAARKILTRQLQDASIDLAAFRDLHATAVELQTTTLLLRAVPPIPNETAAFEFAASLDAFEAALAEIVRGAGEESVASGVTALNSAAGLMLQSMARYRAATEAMGGAFAS
jgi:hypothetical protein